MRARVARPVTNHEQPRDRSVDPRDETSVGRETDAVTVLLPGEDDAFHEGFVAPAAVLDREVHKFEPRIREHE
jgi:hypothetical protein